MCDQSLNNPKILYSMKWPMIMSVLRKSWTTQFNLIRIKSKRIKKVNFPEKEWKSKRSKVSQIVNYCHPIEFLDFQMKCHVMIVKDRPN